MMILKHTKKKTMYSYGEVDISAMSEEEVLKTLSSGFQSIIIPKMDCDEHHRADIRLKSA